MKKAEIKPNTVYRIGGYGPDYVLTGDDPFVVVESRSRSWSTGTKITKVTGTGFYLSDTAASGYTKTGVDVKRVLGQIEEEIGSFAEFKKYAKERRERSLAKQAERDEGDRRLLAVIAALGKEGITARRNIDRFGLLSIRVDLDDAEKIVEALS